MPDSSGPALDVRDLVVTGERGRNILEIDRLDLAPGTALGIEGPSGAGKSTLLFALAGLAERATGRVSWNGTDLLSLSADRRTRFRAESIGLIFQDFLLFDELGPAANAGLQSLFAPKAKRAGLKDRAAAVLARLGVPSEARTVASFSGGERQRVGIARALAHDPAILLADEPTANLHRAASDALTDDLLADVRERGRTLIVVSHDERLLSRMDRRLRIADGRRVA
ncbi:ABC transporter ATP-binding protein [Pelagovum pacificum]|uniref:ATP-binding cassette domain-containing protein n=1 Tax=Pelagovum pacificum TaxID=2588711 RepID=A0A5C5GGD8_9RHOB|nr:ATP-binding cassette domain-containing protein [Pelagovum pacificum]QQA43052.1 ATP-binding cassette domain-containing protein [Pelagovum pacificum]TNY33805.1 ATP-binding cassette domain-containing protein [Pelagovum pacificum]